MASETTTDTGPAWQVPADDVVGRLPPESEFAVDERRRATTALSRRNGQNSQVTLGD